MKCDVEVLKLSRVFAQNCADLLKTGDTESGVQTVYPFSGKGHRLVPVFCDQTTDGGGWTVIQRRADLPQREDFYRGWLDYQLGFGNLTGEFWLGLDNIHDLVNETQMELRVDLEDFDGEKRWAKYDLFHIEDSAGKYRLKLEDYQGDAVNDLHYNINAQFSTKDADHDSSSTNCAEAHKGAWWYKGCTYCDLNGFQHRGSYERNATVEPDGIYWSGFRGWDYSLKSTQLSVRPRLQN
ncbi:UNVERIFIED_CONTAM: hypothetical protein GTU68_019169 [Idotea baltica]|nr:hypothetical protein [Idotea baltica]